MQPMIPYLLGQPHPDGKRIANSQTCLRAQDIDDIGDNRHTTFFEMLGNWSMGDYFKTEQIEWMFEFLDSTVGLDMNKIYITCYIGDERYNIPKDIEATKVWQKLFKKKGLSYSDVEIGSEEDGYKRGIKEGERIFYYDGGKNWWSRGGSPEDTPIGDPCGPDSEMFYDFGIPHNPEFGEHCHPNCDCGRFMEIGNNVFMAYKKVADGVFEPLEKPNIDHGSGLERIAAAKLGDPDVFKISLMWPVIEKLEKLSGKKYSFVSGDLDYETMPDCWKDIMISMRVIADHLRAATFLAVDGCVPSNKQQGYVMRRLIRRAVRFAFDLGIEQNFLQEVVPVIVDLYRSDFPEVADARDNVIAILIKEEKAFRQTLRKGLREFEKIAESRFNKGATYDTESSIDCESRIEKTMFTGADLFKLYDTYGFPVELSKEEVQRRGFRLTERADGEFEELMQKQRAKSKTATKGAFKGGLGGNSWQHRRYHTATHLLQSALREVFGPELRQQGSNITEERLRFDFNLDRKMTKEEIGRTEDLINGWIEQNLPIFWREYPTDEALEIGALSTLNERHGDKVKVYHMGIGDETASLEICGGPHCEYTGQLAMTGELNDSTDAPKDNPVKEEVDFVKIKNPAKFKITKEESIAAGIRRIKAVLR